MFKETNLLHVEIIIFNREEIKERNRRPHENLLKLKTRMAV